MASALRWVRWPYRAVGGPTKIGLPSVVKYKLLGPVQAVAFAFEGEDPGADLKIYVRVDFGIGYGCPGEGRSCSLACRSLRGAWEPIASETSVAALRSGSNDRIGGSFGRNPQLSRHQQVIPAKMAMKPSRRQRGIRPSTHTAPFAPSDDECPGYSDTNSNPDRGHDALHHSTLPVAIFNTNRTQVSSNRLGTTTPELSKGIRSVGCRTFAASCR